MTKSTRRIIAGISAVFAVLILTSTVFAQTVPNGGSAPVPRLPPSSVAPPNTIVPSTMSNTPTANVSFSYFGPSAVVIEFLVPRTVTANKPVGCYSGPNATSAEASSAVMYGKKPAGSQFIAFFVRGSRSYVYDTSFGNYCWIDNSYSP